MTVRFVRASRLYEPTSRTTVCHPGTEAIDEAVREAVAPGVPAMSSDTADAVGFRFAATLPDLRSFAVGVAVGAGAGMLAAIFLFVALAVLVL